MDRVSYFMFSFGIAVVLMALTLTSAVAQFPDSKDEAKLYELAKKEGTVV